MLEEFYPTPVSLLDKVFEGFNYQAQAKEILLIISKKLFLIEGSLILTALKRKMFCGKL